jgi:hypothetical protein
MYVSRMMFGRLVTQVLLLCLILEVEELLGFNIKEQEVLHLHST